jgi:hypothetical protein
LKAIGWWLKEDFGVDADEEWASYEKAISHVLRVDRLEPLLPTTLPAAGVHLPPLTVTFHPARMNTLPYLVAEIDTIFGSPASVFLTRGNEHERALGRLGDVFRIRVQGRAYRDFVDAGRMQGKSEEEIVRKWKECEQSVMGTNR